MPDLSIADYERILGAKFPRGEKMTVDEVAAVVGPEFKEMNENPPESVVRVREQMQNGGKVAGRITVRDLQAILGNESPDGDLDALARKLNSARGERAVERVLDEADEVLKTFGVETIWEKGEYDDPAALYLNTGDTYNATLVYDIDEDELYVGTWGDWVEEAERGGRQIRASAPDRTAAPQDPLDYKVGDRVMDRWMGKGTVTEVDRKGLTIEWDNGDVSHPMVGSAMLSKDRGVWKVGGGETDAEGKFEKGKPADPCKNMSEAECAEWKRQNERHRDQFKGAATPSEMERAQADRADADAEEDRARADRERADAEMAHSAGKVKGPGNPDGTGPGRHSPECPHSDKEAGFTRQRLTWATREAARAPTGLYGFTRKTQQDVEASVRKVNRRAGKIAKAVWRQDEHVAAFLTAHAKRARSAPARILVTALKEVGPRVASVDVVGRAKRQHIDPNAWYVSTDDGDTYGPYRSEFDAQEAVDSLRRWTEMEGIADSGSEVLSTMAHPDKPIGVYSPRDLAAIVAEWREGQERWAATEARITMTTEQQELHGQLFRVAAVDGDARQARNASLAVQRAYEGLPRGTCNRQDYRTIRQLAAYDVAAEWAAEEQRAPSRRASREASYGLYGHRAKTAQLGLGACSDLRSYIGEVAYSLHTRRASMYDKITGFLKEHGKAAKCRISKLLLASYPDRPKVAAAAGAYLVADLGNHESYFVTSARDAQGSSDQAAVDMAERLGQTITMGKIVVTPPELLSNDDRQNLRKHGIGRVFRMASSQTPGSVSDWLAWEG